MRFTVVFWEIIADRLHAEGWSYGIAEHFTKHGLLFCVDAHRDGKRFIVKADDLLTAFLSLERDTIALKAEKSNQNQALLKAYLPAKLAIERLNVGVEATFLSEIFLARAR